MEFLNEVLDSLEEKSWYHQESILSSKLCDNLLLEFKQINLRQAAIGRAYKQVLQPKIRKSKIHWIENWQDSPDLLHINELLTILMRAVNEHFYLSLKRIESQFSYYAPGGFYKKHLDQHKKTRNRLVTCIFYLNDCAQGGELVLYDKNDKKKVEKVIYPKKGSLVAFFSGHIYHEVKPVHQERFAITTWMRDDLIVPLF